TTPSAVAVFTIHASTPAGDGVPSTPAGATSATNSGNGAFSCNSAPASAGEITSHSTHPCEPSLRIAPHDSHAPDCPPPVIGAPQFGQCADEIACSRCVCTPAFRPKTKTSRAKLPSLRLCGLPFSTENCRPQKYTSTSARSISLPGTMPSVST